MRHGSPLRVMVGLALALGLFVAPACALADTPVAAPTVTEARSWILEDSHGNVLAESNADAQMEPASITKIMTAMVVLDSGVSLDDVLTVPEMPADWDNPQLAGYEAGSQATVGDLLKVMLVFSANDAAQTLGTRVFGNMDAFVQKMNEKAASLGMTSTHFTNPSGMEEEGLYSTARDLSLMGRCALARYPVIAELVRTHAVTVPVNGQDQTFYSTDELMPVYAPLVGIKTGRVSSGTTFLGAARSKDVALFSCVLGCETSWGRFQDTQDLFQWAYARYADLTFAKRGQALMWRPFAYRFGYVVPVVWDQTATGPVWPDGGACRYRRVVPKKGQLLLPGQRCGASVWTQDGRTLCAASLSVAPAIVRA